MNKMGEMLFHDKNILVLWNCNITTKTTSFILHMLIIIDGKVYFETELHSKCVKSHDKCVNLCMVF